MLPYVLWRHERWQRKELQNKHEKKAQVCLAYLPTIPGYFKEIKIEISVDASYSLLPPPLFTSSFSMPRSAFFTLALSEPKR